MHASSRGKPLFVTMILAGAVGGAAGITAPHDVPGDLARCKHCRLLDVRLQANSAAKADILMVSPFCGAAYFAWIEAA